MKTGILPHDDDDGNSDDNVRHDEKSAAFLSLDYSDMNRVDKH